MSGLDDRGLMEHVVGGDQDAFGEFASAPTGRHGTLRAAAPAGS